MDRPSLSIGTPVVGLVVKLFGVCFPVLRIFLPQLVFARSILCFLASLFLNFVLAVAFAVAFPVSRRSGLEILGKFKVVIL